MSDKLRYSRWRRLPGSVHRITERKVPRPEADLERLTLYLPGHVLDCAAALAQSEGIPSLSAYCERLLRVAIESEDTRHKLQKVEDRRGALRGLDAIANDPDYLTEWNASMSGTDVTPKSEHASLPPPVEPDVIEGGPRRAVEIVQRHAGRQGDVPGALIPSLRRGEPIELDAARELLQALVELERVLQGTDAIDRSLAFALHRLAFESQILVTEAWPGLGADPALVDTLRLVQEAVDRVLSGEDIRYGDGGSRAAFTIE